MNPGSHTKVYPGSRLMMPALRERLARAGYRDSTVINDHPWRKRVYFFDPDGNDWEFVEYLTDDPEKRHDYLTPGK
jgi:hypothetical protein